MEKLIQAGNGSSGKIVASQHRQLEPSNELNSTATATEDEVQGPLKLPHEIWFSPEIVSQILSHLLPNGFQVSNHPSYDSDVATVRAVLKTSVSLKSELLRQILSNPLRVYITNGGICGCNRANRWLNSPQESRRPLSTLLLSKLTHLPLQKWPVLELHLAPRAHKVECDTVRRSYPKHLSWAESSYVEFLRPGQQDARAKTFLDVMSCIGRQSRLLAEGLRLHCESTSTEQKPRRNKSRFYSHGMPRDCALPSFTYFNSGAEGANLRTKIVFEDPPPEMYGTREMPFWTMHTVCDLLAPWKWTAVNPVFEQVRFPREMVVQMWDEDIIAKPSDVPLYHPHSPGRYAEAVRDEFEMWWLQVPPPGRRYTDWYRESKIKWAYDSSGICLYSDWYLNKKALITNSPSMTFRGFVVVALWISEVRSEGGNTTILWDGKILACDRE